MQLFSFKSLAIATNDFSMENKLGEGGFKPVYKVIKIALYINFIEMIMEIT